MSCFLVFFCSIKASTDHDECWKINNFLQKNNNKEWNLPPAGLGDNRPTVDGEKNSLKDHRATQHRCGAAAAAVSAGVISLKLYPSCSPCPHPVGKAHSVCFSILNRRKRKEKRAPLPQISPLYFNTALLKYHYV